MAILMLLFVVVTVVGMVLNLTGNRMSKSGQRRIGDGRGMSLAQVSKVLGRPQSQSVNADGDLVCQWMAANQMGGHHFVYVFRNGICLGMSHRSASGL